MPKTNCAVVGCGNCTQNLNKWKTNFCDIHGCNKGVAKCVCEPPFQLLPFPTRMKSPERRIAWITKLKRVDPQNPKMLWEPNKNSRVCSMHFEPGTYVPSLNLGQSHPGSSPKTPLHKKRKPPTERVPIDTSSKKQRREKVLAPGTDSLIPSCLELLPSDVHDSDGDSSETLSAVECVQCDEMMGQLADKGDEIRTLKKGLATAERQLANRKRELCNITHQLRKKCQTVVEITYTAIEHNPDKVNFYTGLPQPSSRLFAALHKLVSPLVKRLWRGSRIWSSKVSWKSPTKKKGPQRKLSSRDELLLTLMRMRLGLMNKDVAYRMGISQTLASQIFTSWVKALHTALHHLVYMPSKESLIATKPARYTVYPDLRDIIDCSEIFIETPKDLHLQALCWSDYKHHSTIKFLISVTPTGMIAFISKLFCGRASDKAVTNLSGYYDTLEPYDQVMADKGFLIHEELAKHNCSLAIPPGKRGNAQMTPAQVASNKRIANVRIIVEQVIRRLKCYKILKNIMPLTLLPHADNILMVCAALCNLQPPINK